MLENKNEKVDYLLVFQIMQMSLILKEEKCNYKKYASDNMGTLP
jgi:hypothetical protein